MKNIDKYIQFNGEKIFFHGDRILEWINHGDTYPITVELAPTNKCNHNCPRCAGGRHDNSSSLSLPEMKSIIDQISRFARSLIITGGGEPFCNKNTEKIITYAKKKKLDIGIITNGSLLSKKNINAIVKNCNWIRISIDADNPEDYHKIHGCDKNIYDKTWKNIKLLIAEKNKTKSKCLIGIAYLTSKESANNINNFYKIAQKNKIDFVNYRPFNNDTYNALKEIQEIQRTKTPRIYYPEGRYLCFQNNDLKRKYKKCFGHHFVATIMADANLYICCQLLNKEKHSLGNLKKKTFEEIWRSPKRKKIINNLDLKKCDINCRNHSFNNKLWDIYLAQKYSKDINFL